MTVHVVGAGLAGLAAALALADRGREVVVHEATRTAGGRCRSWHDPVLDRVVDNGAHVVVGANRAVRRYLERLGARDRLLELAPAALPFLDLRSGARWSLAPGGRGAWLLDRTRRPPGVGAADLLRLARLRLAGAGATVASICPPAGAGFAALWEPLCTAVLNTAPAEAAARPLGRALVDALLGSADDARVAVARVSLADAFIDPALAALGRVGATLRLDSRIDAVELETGGVAALARGGSRIALGPSDAVVLAVPAWEAARLLPAWIPSLPSSPIVNLHARLPRPGGPALLGLVGGTAQFVSVRGDLATAVVSAADSLVDADPDSLGLQLWGEVARALGLTEAPAPRMRIVKERRATLRQTPAAESLRPPTRTAWPNLVLAGDWVRTALPCTLEGAIVSGFAAAAALARDRTGEVVP